MKRSQVILISFAILSIVGLYSLPRVVVDNDSNLPAEFLDENREGNVIDHSTEIPTEAVPRIQMWKSELLTNNGMNNNVKALDSLILVFQQINKYDSAAYYAGTFADSYAEVANLRKAGDAYYEAFTFAVDQAKGQRLAARARAYYNKILDQGVNDLEARNNIAMTLMSSSNPMQGVMMIRQILEEDPKNEKALLNMGLLSIQSRQFDRAIERFKSLVTHYPEHLEGNYFLAVSYFETGDLANAKTQFEKVKKLDIDPMVTANVDDYLQRINRSN